MVEEKKTFSGRNVSVEKAAKIMGKDPYTIRCGLQDGIFPIGHAYKLPGSTQYTYYISPKLLYEYTGYDVENDND